MFNISKLRKILTQRLKTEVSLDATSISSKADPVLYFDDFTIDLSDNVLPQGDVNLVYIQSFETQEALDAADLKVRDIIKAISNQKEALKALDPMVSLTNIYLSGLNMSVFEEEGGNKSYVLYEIKFHFLGNII